MVKSKLYFFESNFETVSYYCYIIICSLIIIFFSFYYIENPLVVILIIILMVFSIFSSCIRKMIVYEDAFVFEYKRLFNILTSRKKFLFEEVTSIEVDLTFTKKDIVSSILSSFPGNYRHWNILRITYKNDQEKSIRSKIYKEVFLEVFEIIKSNSSITITIRNQKFI